MIDKIVYIVFLRYARRQRWIAFPERVAGAVVFLPKVLAALSVLHLFVGEDGFVQFQNTTEKVIGFIPLVLLIMNTLYIWHFSDREKKSPGRSNKSFANPRQNGKSGLYFTIWGL